MKWRYNGNEMRDSQFVDEDAMEYSQRIVGIKSPYGNLNQSSTCTRKIGRGVRQAILNPVATLL